MKFISCFIALFFSVLSFSQKRDVQLKWQDKSFFSSEKSFLIPVFDENNFNFDIGEQLIYYVESFPDQQKVDPTSLVIDRVQYEIVDFSKYKGIDKKRLPKQLQPQLQNFRINGRLITQIKFNALILDGKDVKRVTSLSYSYKYASNRSVKEVITAGRYNSVLATGNWHKFKVNQTGVYKLDKNFLNKIGVPSNVDPKTIKIYGHGGRMLPLSNSENMYFDLPEVAIQIVGESDGNFDSQDVIYFYAVGAGEWSEENATHRNLYSNDTYYYITYGGTNGKRISILSQPQENATNTYSSMQTRVFHEVDQANIGKLSRKWFGERFTGGTKRDFELQLSSIDVSQPVSLSLNAASMAAVGTSFQITLNNNVLGLLSLPNLNGFAVEGNFTQSVFLASDKALVSLLYNNGGVPTSEGYLDYIAIDYYRKLQGNGKQFGFENKEASTSIGTAQYNISNASNIVQVLDVTDPYNIKYVANQSGSFSFKDVLGVAKSYHAVDANDYYTPEILSNSRVTNQNLKGTIFNDGEVDYIIITKREFVNVANRLAQFHKANSNLNVKVVPVESIYEEFSSGKQDIAAIRNFVRYVYVNAQNSSQRLKYLNLFGDASYDYLDRVENNNNIVPVFSSISLTSKTANFSDWSSFITDDFYGLMDEEEGLITNQNYSGIDVAVGRMPFTTSTQAGVLVDKIIQYHSVDNAGRWKNSYVALADDVDALSDVSLQRTLEEMVETLNENKPFLNFKKIYTDAYTQQVSAGGARYPKAKEDFISGVNTGALMVNYLGHGNNLGLAQERLLEPVDIQGLQNSGKYPLFAIMTCEFTMFDNPEAISGGELLFQKKDAGAIALLATTRKIGISNANVFTKKSSEYLFNIQNVSSDDITIAESLRMTKNETNNAEKAIVFYIGDPALKLSIPKTKIELTHINDVELSSYTGSLRALDLVKISGRVANAQGATETSFNGDVAIQIFDKSIARVTLGNDGIQDGNGQLNVMNFNTLGEVVFRGNATVTNGVFQIEFVVPKDIKIAVGQGKASFYAVKSGVVLDERTGYDQTIKIGGVNENAAQDDKGPELKLYMNDTSFISGGVTDDSPVFLAHLQDDNGINTASGIGHDIVAILDEDENNPIVLNEYYETEPNNFRKGVITYPLKNLSNGLHTITLRAWDTYNNVSTSSIQFYVSKNEGVALDRVLNYPNPFVDYTEFWFEHNRPNESLEVQVQVMTISGKIVKTINQTIISDGNHSRDIKWDGRDDFGNKIGKGVYIYRLRVKSIQTGKQSEKIEKLVIL